MFVCFAAESRIGRQPNAIKHATFLQLCRIKCEKGIASSTDSFTLSTSALEASDCSAAAVDDQTVTTLQNSERLTGGQKKPRRSYTRRTVKAARSVNDVNTHQSHVDSTEPHLSPSEIKQETVSLVECGTDELLDQLGVELVQDFTSCEHNRLTGTQPSMYERQPAYLPLQSVDNIQFGGHSGGFQAPDSGFTEPMLEPCITVEDSNIVHTCVPFPSPSQTIQSDHEKTIKLMQQAYYDLLPILYRVCLPVCYLNVPLYILHTHLYIV